MDLRPKEKPPGDPSGIPETWNVKNRDVLLEIEVPDGIMEKDTAERWRFVWTNRDKVTGLLKELLRGEIRSITITRKQGG